ncbi:MAG TPA: peptide ABC transporter substrate-binding protein [Clostridia bacterium]|nr:peptide ABC transporter substrate-binding protein [Clostridia bacterium]HRX42243.1 peptide ABC transporter substrate-binding protein [Clostridia bacterium]
MKRVLVTILALALVIGLMAGCSAGAKGGELNWNIGSAGPKTIDPGLCGASDGGDVINNTFEGLIREKSGVVQPGIAKTWDVSEDGKTVTFNLRKSKWSDGSDLTANDFVYAWLRAMDPDTASEYAWLWHYTNVVGAEDYVNGEGAREDVGIRAVDDYTFEVKLSDPTDYFVSLMSFYTFMPVKQSSVEAEGGEEGLWATIPELAVSNGPFVLTEYTIGDGLRLEANPNYWNKRDVGLSAINGKFIDDENTAYQAYQSGELDFIPSVPTAEVPRLIAEDPNFYVFPLLGTYYYNFNMDLEIWADVRVRKAMAMAIDREVICETLAAGQVPAGGFIPPGFIDDKGRDFFETAGMYGLATDDSKVAEAQALLAEAGYPGGEGFPEFVMLYNTSEGHQTVAELMQEMFKTNLGIECTLENQEWAVFQDTRTQGDYQLSRGGWLTDFMDPSGMLGIFKNLDVAYNDPNYYNPDFEAALNEASSATTPEAHFDALYRAQDIFMNDMPIIPVYHYSDTMLVSDKVVGWDRSVLGSVDFSTATVSD